MREGKAHRCHMDQVFGCKQHNRDIIVSIKTAKSLAPNRHGESLNNRSCDDVTNTRAWSTWRMESANDMFDIGKFIRQHGTHLRFTHKTICGSRLSTAAFVWPLHSLYTRLYIHIHTRSYLPAYGAVWVAHTNTTHALYSGFGLPSSFYRSQHSRILRRVAQLPRALFPAQFCRAHRFVCFLFACRCKMRAVVNFSDERNAHCNMLPILAIFSIET